MNTQEKHMDMVEDNTTLNGTPISYYRKKDVPVVYADVIERISDEFLAVNGSVKAPKYPFVEIMNLSDEFMKRGEIMLGNEVDVARAVYKNLVKAHKPEFKP